MQTCLYVHSSIWPGCKLSSICIFLVLCRRFVLTLLLIWVAKWQLFENLCKSFTMLVVCSPHYEHRSSIPRLSVVAITVNWAKLLTRSVIACTMVMMEPQVLYNVPVHDFAIVKFHITLKTRGMFNNP
jgi:hypothetical protein